MSASGLSLALRAGRVVSVTHAALAKKPAAISTPESLIEVRALDAEAQL
jgi:hypothetical protein